MLYYSEDISAFAVNLTPYVQHKQQDLRSTELLVILPSVIKSQCSRYSHTNSLITAVGSKAWKQQQDLFTEQWACLFYRRKC